jgi:hypothetical protein
VTLDEIESLWAVDGALDQTQLDQDALNTPKLHHKYYKIYVQENNRLRLLKTQMAVLDKDKSEFYNSGATKEQVDMGWELPPKGIILKADIPMYKAADKEIIALTLKIGLQQDKVDYLKTILKHLQDGSFSGRNACIKNAIDFMKWTQGN